MSDPRVKAPAFEETNGSLYVFDEQQLPFAAARIFFVRAPAGALRGRHAHREGQQFLAVVAGRITVDMTDLAGTRSVIELSVGQGVHLPAMVWATQNFIEPESILLVLCDLPYDEADYIRDEAEFRAIAEQVALS